MKAILSARWERLWARHGVPFSVSNPVFERLYAAYSEPSRGYHDISHPAHGLEVFDTVSHLAIFPDCLEAAFFYHDYFNDIGRTDNEIRSSRQMNADLEAFEQFGVSPLFRMRIADNISATTHTGDAVENDDQLICDIDLSSFAAESWEQVCRNTRGLRKEARATPLPEFIANRRRKLAEFLKRDHIYYTPHFRKYFEPLARENIEREILELRDMLAEE